MSIASINFESYFNAGEILKPEFEKIKKRVDTIIKREYDQIKEKISQIDYLYPDFVFYQPTTLNITWLGKRIQKFYKNNKIEKEIVDFYNKYLPLSENIKKLKEIVKTTTQKRVEIKEIKASKMAMECMVDPLMKALIKHRDEFIKKSGEEAAKLHDHVNKSIVEKGGLDKIAPRPDKYTVDHDYKRMIKKREYYKIFLEKSKEEFVNSSIKNAFDDYMAWIRKMSEKIAKKVTSAEMTGDPWVNSIIVVKTDDGETQKWQTRMIINRSKYGMLFNQFPSRRTL